MSSFLEYAQGCLAGLAVCDALGTTLEFTTPGSFKPLTDMIGGGPFHLKAGQWTDDTSMALCLAESLIECGGFNLRDQMDQYVRWWKEGHLSSSKAGCFDIGNTVSSALSRFIKTGEPASGSTDKYSAGNGSIMRLAPVPIFFRDADEAIYYAAESSRGTHQAATCLDACRYLGGIIWGLLHGATKDEVLAPLYHPSGKSWDGMDLAIASNFEEGALLAVNLGEDADTTGAVFGQIAGAFYGLDGIPTGWLEKLHRREMILDFATKLHTTTLTAD